MPYVIFSIDNVSDVHTLAKFMRYLDTLRVMGKLAGQPKLCFGAWEGVIEQSFIVTLSDYDTYIRHSGYVDNQEAVLHVPYDTRQPCVLEYADGTRASVGRMWAVPKAYAMMQTGWTYRPDLDTYFVAE